MLGRTFEEVHIHGVGVTLLLAGCRSCLAQWLLSWAELRGRPVPAQKRLFQLLLLLLLFLPEWPSKEAVTVRFLIWRVSRLFNARICPFLAAPTLQVEPAARPSFRYRGTKLLRLGQGCWLCFYLILDVQSLVKWAICLFSHRIKRLWCKIIFHLAHLLSFLRSSWLSLCASVKTLCSGGSVKAHGVFLVPFIQSSHCKIIGALLAVWLARCNFLLTGYFGAIWQVFWRSHAHADHVARLCLERLRIMHLARQALNLVKVCCIEIANGLL